MPRRSSKLTKSTASSRTSSTRRRCRPGASPRWKRKSVNCATSQTDPARNPEDLQKLADQVQELAKKQQADNDLILKELGKLGKVGGSPSGHKSTPNVTTNAATGGSSAGGKENGYEYKVAAGDTLSIIAKAYRDQGIKVTADQILKANPGLNPNSLKVGQKIFIPAPAQ